MASRSLLAVNVGNFPNLLPASPAGKQMLGAAGNLVPHVSMSRCTSGDVIQITRRVSALVRRPEFGRRFIRVQVNPLSKEMAAIRSVPVQVARELLNAGHRYLDVRTAEEFAAGHLEGSVNVPYLKNVGAGMTKNLNFVEDVSKVCHRDDELVVGCLSGRRSLMAVAELQAAEYSGVTDMMGGYKAWVESGLPTVARS